MQTTPLILGTLIAISLTGCQSLNAQNNVHNNSAQNTLSTEDGNRQVGRVVWDKTGESFSIPDDSTLNSNDSRLVFVRKQDQDLLQTSTNIGIDERFQVSLQPGQFSEVITCAGNHNINTEITGVKTNKLSAHTNNYKLTPKATHYFEVGVDNNNQPTLKPINQNQALALLKDSVRQTHQIRRVVTDCQAPAPAVVVVTPAPQQPPIEINTPIQLDVLFDFDSANIQPNYYQRLENMAEFMKINPNMSAILEGHTDSKGPASYNLRLSQARANAVKTMLVNKYGTDANRLKTVGYGESQPIDTNDTAAGRQNNRRVVAIINQTNQ